MKELDLGKLIMTHYPLAKDCIKGHLGPEVDSMEKEAADDRYYDIKVTRCGHCNMPLNSVYV